MPEKPLIHIINMQTLTTESWTFGDIFTYKNEWARTFMEFMHSADAGVNLSIFFRNAEKLIEHVFQTKGYDTARIIPHGSISLKPNAKKGTFTWKQFEEGFYELTGYEIKDIPKKGVPDYMVIMRDRYDKIKSIEFIEVKSENDKLSYDQLQWMATYKLPVSVAFVHMENSFSLFEPVDM